MEKNVIGERHALDILEINTLSAIGMIKFSDFKKRSSQFFTRTYFEQQKYNLLREENEGFAKLLVELNQTNITNSNIQIVKENI